MTTTCERTRKCTVCGEKSEHTEWRSTNAFGSHDLDTRPPEMERSTIRMWVQTCPSCGYCAPTISRRIKGASEIVFSDLYQRQLNSPEFPRLVNAFLCHSLLEEHRGKYGEAGWSGIYAAWACDDAGLEIGAKKCRWRAGELLKKALERGQRFGEQRGAEEALLVDLLRRSSQFEEALKICNEGLSPLTLYDRIQPNYRVRFCSPF